MRYEIDKNTGFFVLGYGYGSSPTFSSLTVSGATTVGGQLTVNNNAAVNGNLTVSGSFAAAGLSDSAARNARAPRQGLVFDGSGPSSYSIPAFGTDDFSVSLWINQATLSNSAPISGPTNAFQLSLNRLGSGYLTVTNSGVGHVLDVNASAYIQAGKFQLISCVRSSGTVTFYVNGISVGSGAVATNFSAGCTYVGGAVSTSFVTGTICPLIYNRALSASEVVALYEAGAPSGADYNSASNTASYTSDFSANTDSWAISNGNATISGNVDGIGGLNDWLRATASIVFPIGIYRSVTSPYMVSKAGGRYTYTFTIRHDSATVTSFKVYEYQNASNGVTGISVAANTNTSVSVTLPQGAAKANYLIIQAEQNLAIGESFYIRSFNQYNLGLLLAPDAAQAGGGLTWYDTSGNAANITLPASGVSWNVPSSGYWGGNLTVSGGTTTIIGSAPALALKRSSDNSFVGYIDATTTGTLRLFSGVGGSNALAASFPQTGNLLLGTTTDGGYKLRVNGAIYSDGDIYAARANATSSVQLLPTSGVASGSDIASYNLAGPAWTRLNLRTSELAIYTNNGGTTALTLDSSQNATFANGLVAGKTSSVNTITGGDAGAGTSIISFKDGLGATKVNITGDGKMVLSNTTASTSTSTGALQVSGGVGVVGAVNVGGAIAIGNTVQTAVSVASTHKVTISIGGTTYYLLATNV